MSKTPAEEAIEKKFDSLIKEALRFVTPAPGDRLRPYVGPREYQNLTTQATNLVEKVCGRKSAHFIALQKKVSAEEDAEIDDILGILEGARNDYADGFLAELRYLVRADLIDNFLDQAEALAQGGYHCATASLAGAVLEDSLRRLCDKHSVPYDPAKTSIEALNVELARAVVYDKLVQKEITAKAHLRNEADHGRFANVKQADVQDMLRWVRRFVQDHLR